MAVLIPFTARHIETLGGAPVDAVWVDVSDGPTLYWECMAEYWARGDNLTVIEHDVVCRPDVISHFAECPELWCLHAYHNHSDQDSENWRNALGCTRFRKEMVLAVPDAVSSIPEQHRDWRNLCDGIGENLRAANFTHHWHQPPVVHHQMRLAHLASSIGE